ncbi:putative N-acetyltransferase YhbS [Sphingomonas sp. PP-CE-1A-559]|jgi:predicted N-acetyltransferase YhbS|uniref:GNAT family N-acetyltransferase n=1 Tax=Sphingomonas sp. PP-CE-1A-559 TaxID=2135657 RepID=UPI0010E4EA06|nr:putative N-acetyltransferase YhbS [Sphingomonas sp. PP-CE-1A-559]
MKVTPFAPDRPNVSPVILAFSVATAKARCPSRVYAAQSGPEMPLITLVPLASINPTAVEMLLDAAFGPDRFTRTAYTIRGGTKPVAALSFAAVEDGVLVGSIQCWPIALVDDNRLFPLIMVGPVAVVPDHQGDGIGRRLMTQALDAAAVTGLDDALMLIGDPDYYGRFFGFSAERTARWAAPGPVERHRLLARGDAVPDSTGMLGPRVAETMPVAASA